MKTVKLISYLFTTCFVLFIISCTPPTEPVDEVEDVGAVNIALPYEVGCGETVSHTYKEVCDTTEETAKSKMSKIFTEHFQCNDTCDSQLSVTAVKTGTCLFNGPTIRDGIQYDITIELKCVKRL